MGLFDFFKKKKKETLDTVDANSYLIARLKKRIEEQGFQVEQSEEHVSITVNGELQIATAIIEGDYHPLLVHLLVVSFHETHIPTGIETNLVGMGDTIETRIDSAIDNYMGNIFPPIIESFSDTHIEEMDFHSEATGRDILWHPNIGDSVFQGQWENIEKQTSLYGVIEDLIIDKLADKKFNWLKLYISKQKDGALMGECLLNNEVWEEGFEALKTKAQNWPNGPEFLGQKQFIMFRRCDKYDRN